MNILATARDLVLLDKENHVGSL